MIKEILQKQQNLLFHFFENLDAERAESFLRECISCTGVLFFSGIGKSGIIAEKIATTLISTGTRAFFISPTNLLHGDLGMISERDICIFLSKSGETEEILSLIPFLRQRKTRLLSIVSNANSRLSKLSDHAMYLPVLEELCSFNLVPTISTTVQLLFGDLLAVALMQSKQFSLDEYALNHPSGLIGKTLALRVDDLMLKGDQIPLCFPDDLLLSQLVELSNKKSGCLLVTDDKRNLVGIFTDGDLRRSLQKYGADSLQKKLGELMTKNPISIPEGTLAMEALKAMQKNMNRWVQVAPVLKNNEVVGLIRMHDIVQSGLYPKDSKFVG
jgi:arabinose-5-phosphate isomerase